MELTNARDQVSQQLDEAEREITTPGDPAAHRNIESLRSRLNGAYDQLQAAQEKAAALQSAVLAAAAAVKSANDLVKARDVQVLSYSEPITVTVKPAPDEVAK